MPSALRDEIQRRTTALQQRLADCDLDAALITQTADLFYFAGSIQNGVLVVPASGRPVYAVWGACDRAWQESPLEQTVPLEDLRDVPAIVHDAAGSTPRRIGMELDVVPVLFKDRLAAVLGGAEITDVSTSIRLLRSVKSEYELGKMRAAARLAETMLQAGLENLHEGITEIDLSSCVRAVARRGGHDGIVRVRGWNQEADYDQILSGEAGAMPSIFDMPLGGEGLGAAMPYGSSRRRIVAGEPVIFYHVVSLDGYICDETRTLVIGVLPERLERAHQAAIDILRAVEAAIRPGVSPQDLYRLALGRARTLGYAEWFMGHGSLRVRFVGHGVGVELDEWPVLADGFTAPLEPGQVICVEPKMVFPGEGALGIEDQYAVTAKGAERLTLPEQRLFAV